MGVQLLPEVVGVAIIVLVYSFLCLGASGLMIWLVWTHQERDSYVALLSYSTLLGTIGSIIQQFHTFVWWRDIKTEQYEYTLRHLGSPEIAIAGASFGLDLVLFYIQYYTYNVEAMLTLFWAVALTYTVFKFAHFTTSKRLRQRANQLAKLVAIILPAILMALLRVERVQNSHVAFLILANFNIMISLSIGSVLLIAILIKYIYTRHRLVSWNARYLFSRRSRESGGDINVLDQGDGRQSIYDRWLVLRFSIGFVVLATFQLITILSEVAQLRTHTKEQLGEAADLSVGKARTDFLHFLAGVSTSLLVFVVFGTTRTFRQTMYKTFIPRRFRKQPADVEAPVVPARDRDAPDDTDYIQEFQDTSNEGPSDTRLKNIDGAKTTTATDDNGQHSVSQSTQPS
ncbi:uncharacterized protein GGS22DRAFT_195851 [Annulohypoxylon maeteangense]|uniref:uncharacterized protein n=1 Tax=Annulohypoxylon maeteangense TaxID=1927788 RepID=UPI002007DEDA|nr:uncharacterized protein GGS22DRAFT_195851 [Annulohypoxylon maeteangense]KAI0882626.1 hypothetical protein GGS22DRAFT_195851 [Annulohypoxylon maeteangense]